MRSLRPVAGAALVSVALIALTGCSLIGGASDPERDDSGDIVVSSDDADVFALRVGDCMASTDPATEVQTVPTRPCRRCATPRSSPRPCCLTVTSRATTQ